MEFVNIENYIVGHRNCEYQLLSSHLQYYTASSLRPVEQFTILVAHYIELYTITI